jgi:preprotein translocase subunit YajC
MWLAQSSGGGNNLLITIAPFILMFAIFYFLLIRPQQKKQKQRGSMLNALKKGDKVVTVGGMHGTIAEISDDTVVINVNDVTKLTFDRSSVNNVSARSIESNSKGDA